MTLLNHIIQKLHPLHRLLRTRRGPLSIHQTEEGSCLRIVHVKQLQQPRDQIGRYFATTPDRDNSTSAHCNSVCVGRAATRWPATPFLEYTYAQYWLYWF